MRTFKLLPESIVPQTSSPTLRNLTKTQLNKQYETSTAIEAARQIAPLLHARVPTSYTCLINYTCSYMFTIEEVCDNSKKFTYICTHNSVKGTVEHVIIPTPKKIPPKTVDRPPIPVLQSPIKKKKVLSRTNTKSL